MSKRCIVPWISGSAGLLAIGATTGIGAVAAPSTLEVAPPSIFGRTIEDVDVGAVRPIEAAKPRREGPQPVGNPLWSIPLSTLTATQDRPLFSASRRPPPQVVVAPRVVAAPPPPPPVVQQPPSHPTLALIGAVVGERDAVAVFVDRSTQAVIRLRPGESYDGWVLSLVQGREVTLKKGDQGEVLGLPRAVDSAVNAPPLSSTINDPIAAPTAGLGNSSVPFIPRSTPKNGESDGL